MLNQIKALLSKYWGFVLLCLMAAVVISKIVLMCIIVMLILYIACVFVEVLTF